MALQSHSLIKEQERYPVCLCDSMFQRPISCDQCCKSREGIILVFETGVQEMLTCIRSSLTEFFLLCDGVIR